MIINCSENLVMIGCYVSASKWYHSSSSSSLPTLAPGLLPGGNLVLRSAWTLLTRSELLAKSTNVLQKCFPTFWSIFKLKCKPELLPRFGPRKDASRVKLFIRLNSLHMTTLPVDSRLFWTANEQSAKLNMSQFSWNNLHSTLIDRSSLTRERFSLCCAPKACSRCFQTWRHFCPLSVHGNRRRKRCHGSRVCASSSILYGSWLGKTLKSCRSTVCSNLSPLVSIYSFQRWRRQGWASE